MQQFELDYADLVDLALHSNYRETRNGKTYSTFAQTLVIDMTDGKSFPIIQGRKMFPKGVLGELAAMLRKPTHLSDFENWGCNYWKQWAKEDGSICVDYGNAWHADGQIEHLKNCLANNPTDRRMIINGWRPHMLDQLDLPCCHMMYQFYVQNGQLDMIWYQRSVDLMIGLPSDIIFAAAWLIAIANEFGLRTGRITMMLGDCHVYEEHTVAAEMYIHNVNNDHLHKAPSYLHKAHKGKDFCEFEPSDLVLSVYPSYSKLELELKA